MPWDHKHQKTTDYITARFREHFQTARRGQFLKSHIASLAKSFQLLHLMRITGFATQIKTTRTYQILAFIAFHEYYRTHSSLQFPGSGHVSQIYKN